MKKRILHLPISEPWFSMIADGVKKEEYREIKPWISSRLEFTDKDGFPSPKEYDEIHLRNGYGKDRPLIRCKWRGCRIDNPVKGWCPDEFLGKRFYCIDVSEILEVKK